MRTFRATVTILPLVATIALGACGGGSDSDSVDPGTRGATATSSTAPADDVETSVVEPVEGLVASSVGDLAVYASVDDAEPVSTLPGQTEFGSRRVVLVTGWQGDAGEWLEVLLPQRPNGSRGFVRAADVTLSEVDLVVDVDLAARTLRVLDREAGVVVESAVAIGSLENPTPTGDFYLTDILITGDAGSAYGPYALGLSAHSDTLSEFGGGDGQIGIHGTNEPSSIGQAVSHGCVRVPNDVVTALAQMLPLGTPVVVH